METSPGKEGLTILRRLIAYSEKIFGLSEQVIASIVDRRPQPRISTSSVIKSVAALLLDHEPQRTEEDEVATGLRLLERVIADYPRAFDLVLADALYATAPFFNFLLARGKHALVVLKNERRNLYQDVAGLFDQIPTREGSFRSRKCLWWDFPDLLSWPQVNAPVRVIRSLAS